MKKSLIGVLTGIAILFLIASVIGIFYLGPIVKVGIERFGPQITKVSVAVNAVIVSPLSGSATIKGLVVGNPSGYSSPQAINVGNIAVSLDTFSIPSDKIIVHSIHVDSPEITFQVGLGGNNLSKILSNVNSSAKNPSVAGGNSSSSNGKPASKIEIDDFLITNAKVRVSISGVVSQVVPLPEIHLTNLGKNGNGLSVVEIIRAILTALLKATVKAVASSAGTLNHAVGSLTSSLGSLL